MDIKNKYKLGAHLSIAGNILNVFKEASFLEIKNFQCFTKNSRQWHFTSINEDLAEEFIKIRKESDINFICSHASYLINLGSEEKDLLEKSKKALKAEMARCSALKLDATVLHPGVIKQGDSDKIKRLADIISECIQGYPDVTLALENGAGQGNSFPRTMEELSMLYYLIKKKDK